MTVELFPCIDLVGGRCVRLLQGRLDDVTVYDPDPVGRARAFALAGARWIHVVDLDRALDTGRDNRAVIAAICAMLASEAPHVRVETGGGLRAATAVEEVLDAGVARAVLGTAAVENPALVRELAGRYPGRIVAAVDAYEGEVTVRGWAEGSGIAAAELARRLEDSGVAALLATEVSRDGMLSGPDLHGTRAILAAVDIPVLASGGVASLEDLRMLAVLESDGRRLEGVVVGKAIYEGYLDVAEAIAVLEGASA